MDDQLTINDLPVECIDQILKCITDRIDRIYARFVCKLWCALIDQDCSGECYEIDTCRICYENPLYHHAIVTDSSVLILINFSKIFSPFLNSQRRKTNFHFRRVDLRGSEKFWRKKGAGIISLNFDSYCENIPLMDIIEHCSVLRTIVIRKSDKLPVLLQNCIVNGKRNKSVRSLVLTQEYLDNVTTVVESISQVFLGVQKVLFEIFSAEWTDNKVNLFCASFKNIKFEITLSNRRGTFVFDTSGKVPVRMTNLYINEGIFFNELPSYLSRYTCGFLHLEGLMLPKMNEHYRLDDLHELVNQCPSLKSINLLLTLTQAIPMTNPLSNNNIEHLFLSFASINDVFFQSFKNLKFLIFYNVDFSKFVTSLSKLPRLEKLSVNEGDIDDNSQQTISNERLLELRMPTSFLLQTIAKYDFRNLRKLEFCDGLYGPDSYKFEHLSRRIDQFLKSRMSCPKLEFLDLDFIIEKCDMNEDLFKQLIANILGHFPRMTKFLFYLSQKMKITDEILKMVLESNRRFRQIGSGPKLSILSPTHIKLCEHKREIVYYIPE